MHEIPFSLKGVKVSRSNNMDLTVMLHRKIHPFYSKRKWRFWKTKTEDAEVIIVAKLHNLNVCLVQNLCRFVICSFIFVAIIVNPAFYFDIAKNVSEIRKYHLFDLILPCCRIVDKIACPNALCILVKRNPQFAKFLLGKSTGTEADSGHQLRFLSVQVLLWDSFEGEIFTQALIGKVPKYNYAYKCEYCLKYFYVHLDNIWKAGIDLDSHYFSFKGQLKLVRFRRMWVT